VRILTIFLFVEEKMQKEYKTVLNSSISEIEEKRSRFITSVKPAQTEDEAVEFISMLKTKYWDATHNVYSYYICGNNIIQRFSDDGEPSGTAGMPVLEVIKRMGVQNIVVVVTRYFGGTLLGASGLIRAYSKSAAIGIERADIVRKQLCLEMNIIIEYDLLGKIQNLLAANNYILKNSIYEQDVELKVYIPVDDEMKFVTLITEATSARAIIESFEKVYITLNQDGKLI
jgi:uncharacterized YigZ family protein